MLTKTTDKTSSAVRALRKGTEEILASVQNAAMIALVPQTAKAVYS